MINPLAAKPRLNTSLIQDLKAMSPLHLTITTVALAALSLLACVTLPSNGAVWTLFGAGLYAYATMLIGRFRAAETFYTPTETLETNFFEWINRNQKTINTLIINTNNPELIVENYCARHILSAADKDRLVKVLRYQLEDKTPENSFFRPIKLGNGKTLKAYRTQADGSCAFHAILGTNQNGTWKTDAKEARKIFCDWIKSRRPLRHKIRSVLDSYYDDRNQAPSYFTRNTASIYARHQKPTDKLPDEPIARAKEIQRRENIKEAFVSNPEVLRVYLENMMNTGTFLLQDELMAVGECFGKNVILYQPSWGINAAPACSEPDAFVDGSDTVLIWFDPAKRHYERAALTI
jgi:hypothetical protein